MIDEKDNSIIFLDPIFKEYIWGGKKLHTSFLYEIPGETAAECWGIASHDNGSSTVASGQYKGMTLMELFEKKPELFGTKWDKFPLLVKILDTGSEMSIQVHPDDDYAGEHENGSLGKTESWYIVDCEDDSELILGHHAQTKEELVELIANRQWEKLIKRIHIKKGDFIQINPGTMHSLKGGVTLLETQRNSDITYRVYDFDRLEKGKPRTLHIDKALDVLTVPDNSSDIIKNYSDMGDNVLTELISCPHYTVWKLNVKDRFELKHDNDFMNVSVIEGEGFVNDQPIKKGSHFILPNGLNDVVFAGDMELILSAP